MPPFRFKRSPLLAAICIIAVRGSLVNLGFFLQAKASVMGLPVGSTVRALLSTAVTQYVLCSVLFYFLLLRYLSLSS
jgi:homogentisate phytyltransferase/homogentisate geranylgeranyltransferase